MKIIAFIMAVLVLGLSIMPCGDSISPSGKHEQKSELTQIGQHGQAPSHDSCTPFCHCTCCSGFSLNHFIASSEFVPFCNTEITSLHRTAKEINISLPVWQPPQLV